MEQLSTLLKKLDDQLNCFISLYQATKDENAQLIKKIDFLESSVLQLQSILEEKRTLLDVKNDESLFAAMLIEDLLHDLSTLCPIPFPLPTSLKEHSHQDNSHAFDVVSQSSSEEGFLS